MINATPATEGLPPTTAPFDEPEPPPELELADDKLWFLCCDKLWNSLFAWFTSVVDNSWMNGVLDPVPNDP